MFVELLLRFWRNAYIAVITEIRKHAPSIKLRQWLIVDKIARAREAAIVPRVERLIKSPRSGAVNKECIRFIIPRHDAPDRLHFTHHHCVIIVALEQVTDNFSPILKLCRSIVVMATSKVVPSSEQTVT